MSGIRIASIDEIAEMEGHLQAFRGEFSSECRTLSQSIRDSLTDIENRVDQESAEYRSARDYFSGIEEPGWEDEAALEEAEARFQQWSGYLRQFEEFADVALARVAEIETEQTRDVAAATKFIDLAVETARAYSAIHFDGANGPDGLRPQISHLKDKRDPVQTTDHKGRHGCKYVRRRSEYHIGLSLDFAAKEDSGHHEAHPTQDSADPPLICCDVRWHSHHSNPIDFFTRYAVVVSLVNATLWEMRNVGDNVDLGSVYHPLPSVLVGSVGNGVDLRREIVGEEPDLHPSDLSSSSLWR